MSTCLASRESPERKGQERKKRYKLPLDIFKHGIGSWRAENLSENQVKVINAWNYGEIVGQEEKIAFCINYTVDFFPWVLSQLEY